MLRSRLSWIALLSLLVVMALPVRGSAQVQTGKVSGTVTDSETGEPVEYVNVVVGTIGVITGPNGKFLVENVPPGVYSVKVVHISYKDKEIPDVVVSPGRTTELGTISVEEKIVAELDVVEIKAKVDRLKKAESAKKTTLVTSQMQKIRAINTTEEAIATQAGVTQLGGQIHVRGGRSSEVKYLVDGMPVSDAFAGSGGTGTLSVSIASQAGLELLTGGMDAEYGNAQSGVIEIATREGGETYTGQLRFMTDDFGAPDKTYFNYDNIAFGFGGPVPRFGEHLRFYISGEGVFQDTYLKTLETRPARRLLFNDTELASLRDRQENELRGQAKMTWRLDNSRKLAGEYLFSRSNNDWYHHCFSRIGYWSESVEHWWFERLDSTYTYYNGPEHNSQRKSWGDQYKMVYTNPLSEGSYFKFRAALYRNRYKESVQNKDPAEYVPFFGNDRERDPENLFYAISGDYPIWEDRESKQYTFRGDYQARVGEGTHEIKSGFTLDYFQMDKDRRRFSSEDNPLGTSPNQYDESAVGGVLYVQDRLRYKRSMVMNAGVRFDFFDTGENAIRASNQRLIGLEKPTKGTSFLERWKAQVSPRVGMSYPISDRDVLHFHYGRFFQLPDLEYLYDYTNDPTVGNSIVGNAFLDPETTISYQFGVRRQLTDEVFIDSTVFFKDIFGLIDTEALEAENESEQNEFAPDIFINQAYGSVRGLEISLEKRFSDFWQGGLTYTLSRATGSSSDPNQGALVSAEGLDRQPITEVPLDWDRTHVVNAYLYFSDPGIWGVNFDFQYGSGAPTTPMRIGQRTILADEINSIRLPETMNLNLRANKLYSLYGREFRLFLEGRNVLDRKNVRSGVRPWLYPTPTHEYYREYYTEYGELGGAYNLRDTINTPDDILVPLNDPRVWSAPRHFRVGIAFEW
jgi:outer membrane receptor protein involved in Fe transport